MFDRNSTHSVSSADEVETCVVRRVGVLQSVQETPHPTAVKVKTKGTESIVPCLGCDPLALPLRASAVSRHVGRWLASAVLPSTFRHFFVCLRTTKRQQLSICPDRVESLLYKTCISVNSKLYCTSRRVWVFRRWCKCWICKPRPSDPYMIEPTIVITRLNI